MKRLPGRQFKNDDDEPYALVCEEAHRYLGSDIGDTLATGRHNGLVIWVCVQHLQKLVNNSTDLIADILSLCGIIFSFQQRNEKDLEILSPLHGIPNIDFAEHTQKQQFNAGFTHFMTEQHAFTQGESESMSQSTGMTDSETNNEGSGNTQSLGNSWGLTNSTGLTLGENIGESASQSEGTGMNDSGFGNASNSKGLTTNKGKSRSMQKSHSENEGVSNSHSISKTIGRAIGRAITKTISRSITKNSSHTVTHQHNFQARYRIEETNTGKLKRTVPNQIWYVKHIIRTLDVSQCVVSVWNEPSFVMQAPFVPDEGTPEFKTFMLEQIKNEIYERHDYHFVPDMQRTGLTKKKNNRGMK